MSLMAICSCELVGSLSWKYESNDYAPAPSTEGACYEYMKGGVVGQEKCP
jgi:hypothetical protein